MAVFVAVVTGGVTLALLGRVFFRDLDDFQESLDALTKNRLSGVLDDFSDDLWPSVKLLKLIAWLACGSLVGLGVYVGLEKILD
jgi:hypothetical protein